jgi:transcriptional regulator with XRE-family HTH domain
MTQPDLGRRLTALRKEKNMTQEELVEKSHVSVRTIQRIEAGEVLPRMSTVKILLQALGADLESISSSPTTNNMVTKQNPLPQDGRTTLLIALVAGAIYLGLEIILSAMDIAWINREEPWEAMVNLIYIVLSVVMVTCYALFIRGFIVLSNLFENKLLKIGSFLMLGVVASFSILDIVYLPTEDYETLILPYALAAVIGGGCMLIFGISLIRLQDGMGELARIAGVLEILVGIMMITVIFFFIGYIIVVPAVLVEILLLYRGYEYLSRSKSSDVAVSA